MTTFFGTLIADKALVLPKGPPVTMGRFAYFMEISLRECSAACGWPQCSRTSLFYIGRRTRLIAAL